MKGVILEKGQKYYTYLNEIFRALDNEHLKYNWLLTDLECNYYPDGLNSDDNYIWLSGQGLSDIVYENGVQEVQFIWGVLSAFEPSITLEDVLKHPLPYAENNKALWTNPVALQHPKAEFEIVAWDSSLVLFIAKDDTLVDKFTNYFPLSEDLESYNNRAE